MKKNEYDELHSLGLTDEIIRMLRNTGATHAAILRYAKRLDPCPIIGRRTDGNTVWFWKGTKRVTL